MVSDALQTKQFIIERKKIYFNFNFLFFDDRCFGRTIYKMITGQDAYFELKKKKNVDNFVAENLPDNSGYPSQLNQIFR